MQRGDDAAISNLGAINRYKQNVTTKALATECQRLGALLDRYDPNEEIKNKIEGFKDCGHEFDEESHRHSVRLVEGTIESGDETDITVMEDGTRRWRGPDDKGPKRIVKFMDRLEKSKRSNALEYLKSLKKTAPPEIY